LRIDLLTAIQNLLINSPSEDKKQECLSAPIARKGILCGLEKSASAAASAAATTYSLPKLTLFVAMFS
jgi:hypothetical protein